MAKPIPETPRQRRQNATNHVAAEITRREQVERERKTFDLRSKRLLKEAQHVSAARPQ
jgi:hypothetical protein